MYGTSFLVPQETMTLTDIKSFKERAIQVGVQHVISLALATTDANLVVRDIRAFLDLAVGTVNQDEWAFGLAAGLNAGAITSAALPANRIIVFYGIDDYDEEPEATIVIFRTALAGGTTKMLVDLQGCRGFTFCAGMLSEPVVYDPSETIIVDIAADAAHDPEYIKFMGYVIEPRGTVVS